MHGRTLRVTYLLLVFLAAILYYYYDTNIAPPEDAILKTDQVQNLAQTRDEVITEAKKKNVRNITVEEPEKDNQDAQNGKGSKPPVEQTLENHDQKALVAGEQTREDRHAVNPKKTTMTANRYLVINRLQRFPVVQTIKKFHKQLRIQT